MLDPHEWLAAAQALPEGRTVRTDHVCGGGRTLRLTHERDRWRAWCFRCGLAGVVDKPAAPWPQRLARLREERDAARLLTRQVQLPGPPDFDVRGWPAAARVWLFRAGVGIPEIAALGAYWHAASGRVVLPVFDEGRPVYWQARAADWMRGTARPKYVNPAVDKRGIVARYGRGDPLVLTEDILSAFRVGQQTEAWSLLGTCLTDPIAARIPASRPVIVWLDPDAAGRRAARAVTCQLTAQGIDARRVASRADPKSLSDREILHVLES